MELENSSVEAVETGREAAAPEQVTETNHEPETTEVQEPEIPHKVWETARKRAESEAMKRVNAQFAQRFGSFVNPATGQPVQSMEDYFAALDAQQQARDERRLKEKGIDPSVLNEAVKNSPAVRQANALLEQQRADEAKRQLDAQIAAITALDPEVKSLADIAKLEEFGQFDALVKGGMKLDDAYKVACFERLASRRAEAAKQAAINAAKGKQHLTTTDGAAEMPAEIPAGELAKWKGWFPDKSMEQLATLYNRAKRQGV